MPSFWNKDGQHKTLMIVSAVIGVIALVLLVIAVFFALRTKETNPIVLDVGGTIIHKKEYDMLVKQGETYKISANDVRATIIDYYKNKIVAGQMKIEVNTKYPTQTQAQMVRLNLQNKKTDYNYQALAQGGGELIDMMIYNAAFTVRTNVIKLGGYTMIVFDFPAVRSSTTLTKLSQESAKADAEALHKRIVSGEIVGDKAVNEAYRLNERAGRGALGGFYYVSDDPNDQGGISGIGIQTAGFLGQYIRTLQHKGISDVSVTQGDDYFFVDYLSHDKANPGIESQITSAKNKIRVVEYDK